MTVFLEERSLLNEPGVEIENQPFAVRRVVLASGWRQGLTSLFTLMDSPCTVGNWVWPINYTSGLSFVFLTTFILT